MARVVRSAAATGRLTGYLCALGAGSLWGTTGPLSTALYAAGAELTGIGFWRIAVASLGFLVAGAARRDLFRGDARLLAVALLGGGALVASFEVSYQFAIAGAGVAGAAALLYTAPVMVAILSAVLLKERVTATRVALAVAVTLGAAMTVRGGFGGLADPSSGPGTLAGVTGGLVAAASYAGTTVLARFIVPRLGILRFLALEIIGGTVILAVALPLAGFPPALPPVPTAWLYVAALAVGTVLLANVLFFAAVRRIEA
ncbi:MAG TPA: DMT family transporter, partial [Gemmatimonadales bacterium]|nr:DMT family transporter [Gemmatimonadales bacterium]